MQNIRERLREDLRENLREHPLKNACIALINNCLDIAMFSNKVRIMSKLIEELLENLLEETNKKPILQKQTKIFQKVTTYIAGGIRANSPEWVSNSPKPFVFHVYGVVCQLHKQIKEFFKSGSGFSKDVKCHVCFNSLYECLNSLYFFKSEQFIIHNSSFIIQKNGHTKF
jgi:hypothetical protein